nr:CPBP family intramembrane glutamic endopeptidase [Deinococcus hopiensis]
MAPQWGRTLILRWFCCTIGFVEEGLYRGLFIKWLLPKGFWTAVLISTVLFSVTHGLNMLGGQIAAQTLLQVGFAFLFGVVAALLRFQVGSLVPLMLWHSVYDTVCFLGGQEHLTAVAVSCLILLLYASWLSARVRQGLKWV